MDVESLGVDWIHDEYGIGEMANSFEIRGCESLIVQDAAGGLVAI
jgi:hypothetical protein